MRHEKPKMKDKIKALCLYNIAPAVASILIGLTAAFLVYQTYYSGPAEIAAIAPAAGMSEGGDIYLIGSDSLPVWADIAEEQ